MYIWGNNTCYNCINKKPNLIKKVYFESNYKNSQILKLLKVKKIKPIYKNLKELNKMIQHNRHQNIVLDIEPIQKWFWEDFLLEIQKHDKKSLVLILDHIMDPHNLGAIIRSAYILGVNGIILSSHKQAPISPTCINVSTGAALFMPISIVSNLTIAIQKLQKIGYWVYSTSIDSKAVSYRKVKFNTATALIVGNEGKGVSNKLVKHADMNIFIKMRQELNSLNVSVATAILIDQIKYSQHKLIKK